MAFSRSEKRLHTAGHSHDGFPSGEVSDLRGEGADAGGAGSRDGGRRPGAAREFNWTGWETANEVTVDDDALVKAVFKNSHSCFTNCCK